MAFKKMRPLAILFALLSWAGGARAENDPRAESIETYVQPYAKSGNFSGAVLVEKDGKVVFEKAYGLSDRESAIENTASTQFHIASLSMLLTATAVLRLVDSGAIRLDQHVGEFDPGVEGADKITIRDLLTQRSGLPDINGLSVYDEILQQHQTPASLVAKIKGQPLLFEPGTKYLHEEHSAYNVLALIVEKKTRVPFAEAVRRLVLQPAGLRESGVDDDSLPASKNVAKGYQPDGTYGLKPAAAIHWSGKTGSGSMYTTAGDEGKLVNAVIRGNLLSAASREVMLDTKMRIGYGWIKGTSKRFGEIAYYMNGRAPGFASFVLNLPNLQLTVVVLSNIYSSATTTIGNDIAALLLGLPYEPFQFREPPPDTKELTNCMGKFVFGSEFYQPNAEITIAVSSDGKELSLRWPSGELSPLIPLGKDHFVDRAYWEEVKIERNASGQPSVLVYDEFRGNAIEAAKDK
jgi:CubicO group peptidase (beta-lactamase class C family)